MKPSRCLRIYLLVKGGSLLEQQELFALINLELVQSLARGSLSPTDAVNRFYHAENCCYVRKHFRQREANVIMSHGVQLPDLFDSLPAEEAQSEFYHELEIIRSLSLKLIEKGRVSSSAADAVS